MLLSVMSATNAVGIGGCSFCCLKFTKRIGASVDRDAISIALTPSTTFQKIKTNLWEIILQMSYSIFNYVLPANPSRERTAWTKKVLCSPETLHMSRWVAMNEKCATQNAATGLPVHSKWYDAGPIHPLVCIIFNRRTKMKEMSTCS